MCLFPYIKGVWIILLVHKQLNRLIKGLSGLQQTEHQIFALLALFEGNLPVTHKNSVIKNLDIFFIVTTEKLLNEHAGDVRLYNASMTPH